MGDNPIDPFNEYSLHDVVDGTMPEPEDYGESMIDHPVTEFYGLHITYLGDDRYQIVYDGHADRICVFEQDDYDDVLELVAELVDYLLDIHRLDKEGVVDLAGKIITSDKERADADPGLYLYVPEDTRGGLA